MPTTIEITVEDGSGNLVRGAKIWIYEEGVQKSFTDFPLADGKGSYEPDAKYQGKRLRVKVSVAEVKDLGRLYVTHIKNGLQTGFRPSWVRSLPMWLQAIFCKQHYSEAEVEEEQTFVLEGKSVDLRFVLPKAGQAEIRMIWWKVAVAFAAAALLVTIIIAVATPEKDHNGHRIDLGRTNRVIR